MVLTVDLIIGIIIGIIISVIIFFGVSIKGVLYEYYDAHGPVSVKIDTEGNLENKKFIILNIVRVKEGDT